MFSSKYLSSVLVLGALFALVVLFQNCGGRGSLVSKFSGVQKGPDGVGIKIPLLGEEDRKVAPLSSPQVTVKIAELTRVDGEKVIKLRYQVELPNLIDGKTIKRNQITKLSLYWFDGTDAGYKKLDWIGDVSVSEEEQEGFFKIPDTTKVSVDGFYLTATVSLGDKLSENKQHKLSKISIDLSGNQGNLGSIAPGSISPAGLSSQYPDDVGIKNHPDVIFHSDFNNSNDHFGFDSFTEPNKYGVFKQKNKNQLGEDKYIEFSTHYPKLSEIAKWVIKKDDRGNVISKTYETLGVDYDTLFGLRKKLGALDQVYVRFYAKINSEKDELSLYPHHLVRVYACDNSPVVFLPEFTITSQVDYCMDEKNRQYWPRAQRSREFQKLEGSPIPSGDKAFWAGVEPSFSEKAWVFYNYWHQMIPEDAQRKDGSLNAYGNSILPAAKSEIENNQWQCIEIMVKANSIGKKDGELSLWIDDKTMGSYTEGSAKGYFKNKRFYEVTNSAAQTGLVDFPGFNFRTFDQVKIRNFSLPAYYSEDTYITQINHFRKKFLELKKLSNRTEAEQKLFDQIMHKFGISPTDPDAKLSGNSLYNGSVSYDDLVLAKSRIGCKVKTN